MSKIEPLKQAYPKTIAEMPHEFDSHDFISALKANSPNKYKGALKACDGNVTTLHSLLAKALHEFPELVISKNEKRRSENVHGDLSKAELWTKVK